MLLSITLIVVSASIIISTLKCFEIKEQTNEQYLNKTNNEESNDIRDSQNTESDTSAVTLGMLLSITLIVVSASIIISTLKCFEIKEQTNEQYLNKTNNEESNDIRDSQNTESDTSAVTLGVHDDDRSKNENDDDDNIDSTPSIKPILITDATSKTKMLPLSKLTTSSKNTEEQLKNINDKVDEIFDRIEMIKKHREQQRQKMNGVMKSRSVWTIEGRNVVRPQNLERDWSA
ncbi:hypothetical protein Glove_232g71 [Diversispora epigaea]|uniref:Uncharacterized protein n=1 Tax=Diversispora epigaea TaxID=1348612 RepID=A0A397IBG7_9GLOM|nr:hypothetical protein Glove_232g71 [Diversispora epigaea]